MKIVFIAGPYGDKSASYLTVERNIANARFAAATLVNLGYGYFCPHMNSAHFEHIAPDVPVEFWLEMGKEIMRCCDAVLVLADSPGTEEDMQAAVDAGLPVFRSIPSLMKGLPPNA